jgi:hypothetical protein
MKIIYKITVLIIIVFIIIALVIIMLLKMKFFLIFHLFKKILEKENLQILLRIIVGINKSKYLYKICIKN